MVVWSGDIKQTQYLNSEEEPSQILFAYWSPEVEKKHQISFESSHEHFILLWHIQTTILNMEQIEREVHNVDLNIYPLAFLGQKQINVNSEENRNVRWSSEEN